ncbi:MAG: hypothetical protein LBO66_13180 [Deltaproteobacteria bacterium]|nr:hypothetical protein [Deltaproteobacteria bacterium]
MADIQFFYALLISFSGEPSSCRDFLHFHLKMKIFAQPAQELADLQSLTATQATITAGKG